MRKQSLAAAIVVVSGILVGCGSDQSDIPAAAPPSEIATTAVSPPSTLPTDTSLGTTVPDTPTKTAAPPTEPSPTTIEATTPVRFAAPNDVLAVTLPLGFKELREPRVEGGTALVSLSFLNDDESKRLIVSMTRGQDADEQLSTEGVVGADTVEFTTVAGLRPEGDVRMWTDSFTKQRGLAWAADDVTVIWVFGNNMTDEELQSVVRTVEVSAP